MRAQGFSGRSARRWVDKVARSKRKDEGFTRAQKRQAYRWGFLPAEVENFGITEENRSGVLSERDYLYLHPINGTYDKWLRDRISTLSVFGRFDGAFEPCDYHIIRRAGAPFIIPLSEEAEAFPPDVEGLRSFLTSHGPSTIASAAWRSKTRWTIAAAEGSDGVPGFLLDGVSLTVAELGAWLGSVTRKRFLVIYDAVEQRSAFTSLAPEADSVLHVRMINPDGAHPRFGQAFIEVSYEDAYVASLQEDDGADLLESDPEDGGDAEDLAARAEMSGEADEVVVEFAGKRATAKRRLFSPVDSKGRFEGLILLDGEGRACPVSCALGVDLPYKGTVPCWDSILDLLEAMLKTVPQVEFVEFALHVEEDGFVITGASPAPPYNQALAFSPEVNEFLLVKVRAKHEAWSAPSVRVRRFLHNTRLKIRRTWNRLAAPKGLVPYQSTRWPHDVWCDLISSNGVELKTKRWAYRHGFLSYRIPQYGITEENWTQYISDFEYRWLRHINTKYKYWLEDKITIKYVASGYSECLPGYYYYTCFRNGEHRIVPMMDLPEGYGASAEDILRLAREKGVLALKPDKGSHGSGFYKLTWGGATASTIGRRPSPRCSASWRILPTSIW